MWDLYLYYDGVTSVPAKVIFDFICEYVSGELRPSNEASKVMWVPRDKVLEYITSPANLFRF